MSEAATTTDGASVPRARVDVCAVSVDGETVIHRAGEVHVLDPVASLVWRCCDGEVSVDGIAAELAEIFAIPAATARRDVGAVVAQLASLGLLVEHEPAPGYEVAVEVRRPEVLADPPGSCASCAEREWAFVHTYRVGGRLISVGTDSERADRVLRGVLGAHGVRSHPDGSEPPPFFAVSFPDPAAPGAPLRLHLVHRGDDVTARSRRPDRVMRALVSQIATYGDLGSLGLAAVNGIVVARGDRSLIVPEPADPVSYRHALARRGLLVADLPVAVVDATSREVVVGAPGLTLDLAPLAELAEASSELARGSEPEPVPWGRYRLVAFGVARDPSPAAALLSFGPVLGDHRDHAATLAALVGLLDIVPVVAAVRPDAIDALLARA